MSLQAQLTEVAEELENKTQQLDQAEQDINHMVDELLEAKKTNKTMS